MGDVLIFGDTERSPELRHEIPIGIGDPLLYVEKGGERHVVVGSLEVPRLEGLGLHIHPLEEFGVEEVRRQLAGQPMSALVEEVSRRAVVALGLTSAAVPATLPVAFADAVRASGVELTVDRTLFDARRRSKSPHELDGMRRAQAAAEAGMTEVRDRLAAATIGDAGELTLDGKPLTSEVLKAAVARAFSQHGAAASEFVVSHGSQAAIGHHGGGGSVMAGETVVVDLWPMDTESGCYADMTRTFVVGEVSDEVAIWWRLCKQVLDEVTEMARPGITGKELYDHACDIFEAAGFETQRTKVDGVVLEDGFFHSLGHGVGLEVHEEPLLGTSGRAKLVPGDVIAVEPGLYRSGYGGCRLEDLLLVTETGVERLTNFPYDLAP